MLVDLLGLDEDDLESRPMGSAGEDVIMGKQSRDICEQKYDVHAVNNDILMALKVI